MRGLRAAASASAVLLSINACRQVLGVDGYGTKGDYPGQHDGVLYSSRSCRDCVDAHCGDPAIACASDPGCTALAGCLARCALDDHACRGKCNLSNPDTLAMRDLVQCEANHSCTDCGGSRAVWSGGDCDECLATKCPDKLEALSKDRAALDDRACEIECPESESPAVCHCDAADGGEETALAAVRTCAEGPCNAQCNKLVAPPDWSCLGAVQWPPAAPDVAKLELHFRPVTVVAETAPIAHLPVKACREVDIACNVPFVETSDAGWAPLSIERPNTERAFFGHLVTSSDELNALLYIFPPIRLSPSWRKLRMVSKTLANDTTDNLKLPRPLWESKGGIVFSITSCNRAAARGVRVTVDTQELTLYSGANVALIEGGTETSNVGLGAMIDVEPGDRTLTAQVKATGQLIGKYPVRVKIGSITHVTMAPAENEN